ncbi:MAG: PilZ domain-containing protein [Candidatus Omnitrophica bacterium]|nr:PilZ domain-containing protein [Candidatus Omnitrophota bacterium]
MSIERRRFARLYVGVEGVYQQILHEGKTACPEQKALVQNISPVGVRFIACEKLPHESRLNFKLKIAQLPHPIVTQGKVVWQKQFSESFFDTGFEFIDLSDALQQDISNVIRQSIGIVEELREFIRCNLNTAVELTLLSEDQATAPMKFSAVSIDICPSGMKITTNMAMQKHQLVAISFTLPETNAAIRAKGFVSWSKKKNEHLIEAGIEFTEISELDTYQINDFVKQTLGIYW